MHADKLDLGPSTSISPECIIASMVAANAAEPTARSFGIAFLATRSRQALRASLYGSLCHVLSLLMVAAAPSGSSYRASVPRRRARSKPVSCFACAFAQLRRGAHRAEKKVRNKFVNISEVGEGRLPSAYVVEWHELCQAASNVPACKAFPAAAGERLLVQNQHLG